MNRDDILKAYNQKCKTYRKYKDCERNTKYIAEKRIYDSFIDDILDGKFKDMKDVKKIANLIKNK